MGRLGTPPPAHPGDDPRDTPDVGARLAALSEPPSAGERWGLPGGPGVRGDRPSQMPRVDGDLVPCPPGAGARKASCHDSEPVPGPLDLRRPVSRRASSTGSAVLAAGTACTRSWVPA